MYRVCLSIIALLVCAAKHNAAELMSKTFSIGEFSVAFRVALDRAGAVLQTLVVMPLGHSRRMIPSGYYQHNAANPQFTLNAGGRFGVLHPRAACGNRGFDFGLENAP